MYLKNFSMLEKLFHIWETFAPVKNYSNKISDDYGHKIPPGFKYIKGHFLEQVKTTKSSQIFKI